MTPMPEPFLKWAGGKRWLVHRYEHLFPIVFERYVEPFLGGGAVFFSLQPRKALLSDANADLINVYQAVRNHPGHVARLLSAYHAKHSRGFYYKWRKRQPSHPVHQAARLLYLNRVCWNGLFRVNLEGEFNVPLGTKTEVTYPAGYLAAISRSLRRARIIPSDFEPVIDQTGPGDFVYVDPPYTVAHNNNGFLKYNDVLFSWDDQVRLAAAVRRASRRGAMILVSNANHASVRALYYGFGPVKRVARSSILAADATSRRMTSEITFRNYLT